jgi:hypothetical protein
MTVGFYVPGAISRFDETVFSGGDRRIAENLGMMDRINSSQVARSHGPTPIVAAVGAILPAAGAAPRTPSAVMTASARIAFLPHIAASSITRHESNLGRIAAPYKYQSARMPVT